MACVPRAQASAFPSAVVAMAMRALLVFAVLSCIFESSSLLAVVVEADQVFPAPKDGNGKAIPVLDCPGLCAVRCGRHSRPNVCVRACGTCCYRCKCVPPGTSGNRELCGSCYANMTTHGNKPKCP